jgi:hypothetical protein
MKHFNCSTGLWTQESMRRKRKIIDNRKRKRESDRKKSKRRRMSPKSSPKSKSKGKSESMTMNRKEYPKSQNNRRSNRNKSRRQPPAFITHMRNIRQTKKTTLNTNCISKMYRKRA